MPWGYVVAAINRGLSLYHQHLHDRERPIALLASLQANQNRDRKKHKEPYTYLDFSFYKPRNNEDSPEGYYGASYLELLRKGLLPSWALFCYSAMNDAADPSYIPGEPALIAKDAMLLHPKKKGNGYEGLLIALESAGDQVRTFTSTKGVEVVLRVPYVESKAVAREGEFLTP